jgi:conjugative relaxase-like TrwC/TraI family protein
VSVKLLPERRASHGIVEWPKLCLGETHADKNYTCNSSGIRYNRLRFRFFPSHHRLCQTHPVNEMLRITPSDSAAGAKKYFGEGLSRSDYYIDGQEVAGRWHGKAAERLGLSGEVKEQEYFALCDNLHPETGKQLTPRNKENRRVGFDFTFSAPKSVSVLYERSGDDRIIDALRSSVNDTMQDIEREMKTRVRVKGSDHDRETGNMVWADFLHFTARPVDGVPDPHLHMHCYAFNITYDEVEKRHKAGQFGDLKRDGSYWEAAFDARLAHRLNALGIPTEKRGLSFEIAGTPQSLIDKSSRRRNDIERKAAEKGITTAEGKHAIGYYGREHKNLDIAKRELREIWNARLTDEERSALDDAIHGRAKGDRVYSADEAKEYALQHSFQKASTVSEKRLKAEALKYGVGSVLPEDVADIAQHPEVIAETRGGQLMTTTKTMLNHEIAFLQFAKEGQRKQKPFTANSKGVEFDRFKKGPNDNNILAGLSEEQRKAALHILKSRDTVTGVVGKAGTGKTRMMRATRDALESESGLRVYAFAPSSQASRGVLKKEGFKDADTLEMLLTNQEMQKKTKGQILWVDEAGLVSSEDMRRLMDLAKRNNNRVILSGDYTQHSSVEAGDAFRLLEKEAGVKLARLTEIRRQTDPAYKKAVEAISKGSGKAAQKGFDALDKMGSIIEASGEERHGLLVADYLRAAEEGKSALIIAPTHSEGQRLTDELRSELKERGALGKERAFIARRAVKWSQAQKGDIRNYEPGMVIDFHDPVAGTRKRSGGARTTSGGFQKGEAVAVVGKESDSVIVMRRDGTQAALNLQHADRYEVYRTREIALAKGDRIRITKNGEAKVEGQKKGTRLNNGDVFTVEGFTKEGDIRLEKGKLLPKDWGHMSLGYVDTSYSSQGKTVARVFIAVGNQSLAAANQQQWYVSTSRGQEMAKVYVEDKDEVRGAIARGGQRLSAVELTQTKLKDSWRKRFSEMFERNRIGRFLKQRTEVIAGMWRGREGVSYA